MTEKSLEKDRLPVAEAEKLLELLTLELEIDEKGTRRYGLNGVLHRQWGPAVIFEDGTEIWYQNGLRHRLGGPAVTLSKGQQYWYLAGRCLLERDYWRLLEENHAGSF